ncbi:MAG: FecR domain-containing protein [Alkalinema sp. RU_4_3]|nr:FecR domain-containing protein [Alkalinema sp. RU_4_3]
MNLFALEVGLIGEPAVFQAYPISAIPQAMAVADTSLRLQVLRAIDVSAVTGTVLVRLGGGTSEPAQVGQRLQKIGDSIETQAGAKAVLTLDTQAGTIELAPNTLLRIQHIAVSPKGGYQTQLFLERGQAKVKVKKFENLDSSLEIQTPAG